MKELIILGAGGMGREFFNFAKESLGYSEDFCIKGYLDVNKHILDGFKGYPSILGDEDSYNIQPNDIFISSIGNLNIRKESIDKILQKGGTFISLINKSSHIHTNAKIGLGTIIQPNVSIGSDVEIGNYCMIQNNAVIGHDVIVGSNVRIDCNAMLVGGVIIENDVVIHTNAVINHKVIVHSGATVGACSFVIKNVNVGTTVFGIPAKKVEF